MVVIDVEDDDDDDDGADVELDLGDEASGSSKQLAKKPEIKITKEGANRIYKD